MIDFSRNICYSVQVKSEELVPESNATFFHKICIKGKRNFVKSVLKVFA